uniref:DUF2703 domain-containing protein n=1 Tax=Desulfobacca acetoxidans TaxID=60893 RepID=A0A7V4G8P5_9BACT
MKNITILWRRLVDDQGHTCERCGDTEQEVMKAWRFLQKSFAPVGIDFSLKKESITPEEFQRHPLASNRIYVDGRPLESWLKAEVGQSPCCGPCGDAECRTLTVEGQEHTTIPAELVVKAGLLAVQRLARQLTSSGVRR